MFRHRTIRLHDPHATPNQLPDYEAVARLLLGIFIRLIVAYFLIWLYSDMMSISVRRTAHFALDEMRTDDPVLRRYSMMVLGWGWWGYAEVAILAVALVRVGFWKRPLWASAVMFAVCWCTSLIWFAGQTFR